MFHTCELRKFLLRAELTLTSMYTSVQRTACAPISPAALSIHLFLPPALSPARGHSTFLVWHLVCPLAIAAPFTTFQVAGYLCKGLFSDYMLKRGAPPGPQQVGGHTITLSFSSVSLHLLHSSFTDIILHKTQFLLSCFQAVPSTCTCVYRYQENRDHVLFPPLSPASISVLVLNTQQLSLNIEQTANAFNILNLKGISSKLFYLKGKARERI